MFAQAFANRKVKALLVEPQAQSRAMMVECLREVGITVSATDDMKSAMAMFEQESFDWILLPASVEGHISPIQLLAHIISRPQLRHVLVSLVVNAEREIEIAVKALALGGLSWHAGPFTKTSFSESMNQLMTKMFECGFQTDMVAAHFVRVISDKMPIQNQLLAMESALVRLHSGNFRILVDAAESYKKLGSYYDAMIFANQAKLIETAQDSIAQRLINGINREISEKKLSFELNFSPKNILGFESVAIVDSDGTIPQLVERILKDVGVTNIQVFSSNDAFMAWLGERPIDLVLIEWKNTGLSTSKVIQRVASRKHVEPPQFVIAGTTLNHSDMPLLKELGVSSFIAKPFGKLELLTALLKSQAANSQMSGMHFEHKIRAMLRAKKIKPAMKMAKEFFGSNSVMPSRKLLVQADFNVSAKKFEQAKSLCLKAMAMPHDNLYALQLLGKCFMGLKQFDYAMKCFQKAHTMSPMNVERLCLMAVSEAEQGNKDSAGAWVDSAKNVDDKNQEVLKTATKVALITDDLEAARRAAKELPNFMWVVAFQNNRAVALAKSGHIHDSITIYENTFKLLPESATEAHDIVIWNLALAYIKANDMAKSEEILKKFTRDQASSRVSTKIQNLIKKIDQAKASGQMITLNTEDTIAVNVSNDAKLETKESEDFLEQDLDMLMYVDVKPGEMACFQIFTTPHTQSELQNILTQLPPLKIKWAKSN